jgi:hypothetical protein
MRILRPGIRTESRFAQRGNAADEAKDEVR